MGHKKKGFMVLLVFCALLLSLLSCQNKVILFYDDFSAMPHGPLGSDVGAHTEYQYIAEARPQTHWTVATFRYNLPPTWEVQKPDKQQILVQRGTNPDKHWHPLVQAGSAFWTDYQLEVSFWPESFNARNGMVFRYQNNRSYYFLGVESDSVKLIKVNHEKAFRVPDETVLASAPLSITNEKQLTLGVKLVGGDITCTLPNGVVFSVADSAFSMGKIGLLSDSYTEYFSVKAWCNKRDFLAMSKAENDFMAQQDLLLAQNPKMRVVKKIKLADFGAARNLRFGDLTGNGEIDFLIGQVVHHGPKDRNSELSCLTAVSSTGEVLWQKGRPDPWKYQLTNDVAFQIHDIDGDGRSEVIYCMNQELIIADGSTGEIIRKMPTPLSPGGKPLSSGHNIFPRILGDCIYFCDLQGKGRDSDIILKDRYNYVWAYNANLELLWHNECRTGHYPYAADVDGDGRDELALGYSLFKHDGTKLWSLDSALSDHADAVALVSLHDGAAPVFICAASDEGFFMANLDGEILTQHRLGHVQNPAIGNFRDDLSGLETVAVNFWGNQGIVSVFDAEGNLVHIFEPTPFGSMCLPLNWTGGSEELFVLNANAKYGGAWDAYGRKALSFPDDGHPDMCYAVLDFEGDSRDEIVVWNQHELWVYTQDGTMPENKKAAATLRNPLYNYSNYQATVSVPNYGK